MTDHIPTEALRAVLAEIDAYEQQPDQLEPCGAAAQSFRFAIESALSAALAFLRPEPSEDDREALVPIFWEVFDPDSDKFGNSQAAADAVLAAGFTRRPMPSREQVAREMAMTDDYDGCFERIDEWNALEQWERDAHPENEPMTDREDAEFWLRRADAVLALFKGGDHG